MKAARQIIVIIVVLNLIFYQSVSFCLAASDTTDVIQRVIGVDGGQLPPPPAQPSGDTRPVIVDTDAPQIKNLHIIDITSTSAVVVFETDEPATSRLYYGITQYKESGSIAEIGFFTEHRLRLTELLPNTVYYLRLEARDRLGNSREENTLKFKTLPLPDKVPPVNVSDLEAIVFPDRIELNWKNPSDHDFAGVKIMRSDEFYPQDPFDGENIMRAKAERYIDKNVIPGKVYYYTLFSYDEQENYSSGAVISARIPVSGEPSITPPAPPIQPPVTPPGPLIILPTPEIKDFGLSLDDLIFTRGGERVFPVNNYLNLNVNEPVNIAIIYDKLPEVLKTIVFTLRSGSKSFSFLLRVDEAKAAYEATVAVPEAAGQYPFTVAILGFRNNQKQILQGTLLVSDSGASLVSAEDVIGENSNTILIIKNVRLRWDRVIVIATMLLILFISYIYRKYWRRRAPNRVYY